MRITRATDVLLFLYFLTICLCFVQRSRWTCRKFSCTTTVKIYRTECVCAPTSINKTIVFGLRLQRRSLVLHSHVRARRVLVTRHTLHARRAVLGVCVKQRTQRLVCIVHIHALKLNAKINANLFRPDNCWR